MPIRFSTKYTLTIIDGSGNGEHPINIELTYKKQVVFEYHGKSTRMGMSQLAQFVTEHYGK